MAVTYTKTINSMQAYKDIDGETNVVFSVMWNLVGEENGLTTSCPATTYVPYTAGQPFTPYDQLTQAQVLAWIDEYTPPVQIRQYQNMVASSLQQMQGVDSPNLPWNPSPTPTP